MNGPFKAACRFLMIEGIGPGETSIEPSLGVGVFGSDGSLEFANFKYVICHFGDKEVVRRYLEMVGCWVLEDGVVRGWCFGI